MGLNYWSGPSLDMRQKYVQRQSNVLFGLIKIRIREMGVIYWQPLCVVTLHTHLLVQGCPLAEGQLTSTCGLDPLSKVLHPTSFHPWNIQSLYLI